MSVEEVEMSTDALPYINGLPEEILIYIFSYLDFESLCRARRVCRNWHQVISSEKFWRKVVVFLRTQALTLLPRKTISLIEVLPSCVTHLNLNLNSSQCRFEKWSIDFRDFSEKLKNRCPNLQTLILQHMRFNVPRENVDLCAELPKNIRVLVLQNCSFWTFQDLLGYHDFLKMEVLDVCRTSGIEISSNSFLKMKNLKKLRLSQATLFNISSISVFILRVLCKKLEVLDIECTFSSSTTFNAICDLCIFLTELYVCFTCIKDDDLSFPGRKAVLPRLKVICFRNCTVTSNGINAFLRACTSVEYVYVGSKDEDPENDYSDCRSEKVHALYGYKHCYHHQKVNYMTE